MEHSKNIYGLFVCLFVVYRYVCKDVIITNSTIAYCLQPYLVLHRLLYMFINYFVLQKWPSVLHRLLILSLLFFFLGLRKVSKRGAMFSYLKMQKATSYCLQETYSSPEDDKVWSVEWGGKIIYSHGTTHSKGVCILLNPS